MRDQYLTVQEFSALFKVADKTTYRKTLNGEIPSVRIFGRIRIPISYIFQIDPRLEISIILKGTTDDPKI